MANTDLHYATLLEAAEEVRTRKVSPVELTRAMLNRIEKLEPQVHSYATVMQELALAQAVQAEREIMEGKYRGPLHGIPIAVKDICDMSGVTTAAGMTIRPSSLPEEDSTVVERLTDGGAVVLGKLQLTEGAFAKHHPSVVVPQNPWNSDFYAGASSSGSGVATAAGLAFGTIGSDTGGSIRFPAAANGVTGLKPTWGRVSRYGVFPLAPSLDHIGPLTRSAADAGAMLGVIAGLDPNDPTTLVDPVPDYLFDLEKGIRGVRIGIDASYNEEDADGAVIATLHETRKVLEELGATFREITFPDYHVVNSGWGSVAGVEAAMVHKSTYASKAKEYGPAVGGSIASLIEHGRSVSSEQLMQVHYARLAFAGSLARLFGEIDLLLVPTQPLADFTIAQEAELFERSDALTSFLRFVTPFDMSGSPAVTLPGGFTPTGLPLSFQLVSRHLDEALLVRAGHSYQQLTDWHRRHPEL
jgi:amidase